MRKAILSLLLLILVSCSLDLIENKIIVPEDAFIIKESYEDRNNDGRIKILVISDVHADAKKDRITHYEESLKEMKHEMEDADAIVLLGDIVCSLSESSGRKALLSFFRALEEKNTYDLPVFYVLGNHETDSLSWEQTESYLDEVVGYRENQSFYYAFKISNTAFYILNSAYRVFSSSQLDELEKAVEVNDAQYSVFLSHIPILSNAGDQSMGAMVVEDTEEKARILRILEKCGNSVYLSGHHHSGDDVIEISESVTHFIFPSNVEDNYPILANSNGCWSVFTLDEKNSLFEIEVHRAEDNSIERRYSFSFP